MAGAGGAGGADGHLRAVVGSVPVLLFSLDADGVITMAEGQRPSPAAGPAQELVGQDAWERFAGYPEVVEAMRRAFGGEAADLLLDGNGHRWDIKYRPVRDASGAVTGVTGVCVDVTGEQRADREQAALGRLASLAVAERHVDVLVAAACTEVAALLDAVHVGVSRADGGGTLRSAGGWGPDAPLGAPVPEAAARVLRLVLAGGEPVVVQEPDAHHLRPADLPPHLGAVGSGVAVPLRGRGGVLGTLDVLSSRTHAFQPRDVAFLGGVSYVLASALERAEAEADAQRRALHDPLTGLPNRTLFLDRAGHALARTAREGTRVAVLFIDVDRFKVVNDALGHAAGDRLLASVAGRLRQALREADTVARFGGDEFAVLCEAVGGEDDAVAVAGRVAEALREPVDLGGAPQYVSASVGIAVSAPGDDAGTLLRSADLAMYRAKTRGRARAELFDAAMRDDAVARLELTNALHRALAAGEFRLHVQPEVDLRTGRTVAAEALLRWEHPGLGLLGPRDFLHVAEETGLLVPLGEWVIAEAVRCARRWADGGRALRVCVNLCASQLTHPGLVAVVARALGEEGVPPSLLTLEITESTAMGDPGAAARVLGELDALGVGMALDDFGTGYSSLMYLRRFPMDTIKIDKSFVDGVAVPGEDQEVARAAITLAHSLGLVSVAEGVETHAQLAVLRGMGCDRSQGFLFARPMPPQDLVRWMDDHDPVPVVPPG